MPTHPSRPRDAASLVLVRGEGDALQVLMGRREPRSRFLPSVYVFPGGRLDRADWGAPARSELPEPIVRRLAPHTPADRARALAVAALRETEEETGVALGEQREGGLHPDLARLDYLGRAITPASSAIRYHARFFMARLEAEPSIPRSNGELLDLDWIPLRRALDLPMIDVTTAMLQLAREHALRPSTARDPQRSLFIRFRGEQRLVADED
jgi:8-oxo-dGTP pyrophosphatase MutT (NUDIX family)